MKQFILFLFGMLTLFFIYYLWQRNRIAELQKTHDDLVSQGKILTAQRQSFEDQASEKDIADAKEATKDITCIALAVSSISPYNGKMYEMGVCELNWLVENRGWKEVTTITEKPNNPLKSQGTVTVMAYNP